MKKFILKCIIFALILGIIFVPFAVFVDPYNIFHASAPRQNGVEPNKNYVKMKNVLDHPDKFDSFLFGSSRVGFMDVSLMDDGTYYDMTYSEGLPAEHLDNLKVMIAHGIIPKNVTIGLDDISYFVDPSIHEGQLFRLNFPWLGKPSQKVSFYLRYFDLKTLFDSLDALGKNRYKDPEYTWRMLNTGTENLDIIPEFNANGAKAWWSDYYYPREEVLDEIRQIKELCEEYNINLRFFTNPMHAMTYAKDMDNGYLVFLKELAEVTDYWNFSGFNNVTLNYNNYYETSHYDAAVGEKIIQVVYYDGTEEDLLAQGFGVYVTKENVDELLQILNDQAINFDLPVNTYGATYNKTDEEDE